MDKKNDLVGIYSGLNVYLIKSVSFYFLLILGACLGSCMPVIKLAYGIHRPRYLSDQEVVKYSGKLGWQGEIYRINNYSRENHSTYKYLGNSMPDVLLFNSNGQLTRPVIDCSSSYDSLVRLSVLEIDQIGYGDNTFQKFLEDTYVIPPIQSKDSLAFYQPVYVIKFADYAGLLNKDIVPGIVQILKHRSDVNYIILNMDYSKR